MRKIIFISSNDKSKMIAFENCTYGTQLQLPFYHLSVEAKFFIIAKSFEEETFLSLSLSIASNLCRNMRKSFLASREIWVLCKKCSSSRQFRFQRIRLSLSHRTIFRLISLVSKWVCERKKNIITRQKKNCRKERKWRR